MNVTVTFPCLFIVLVNEGMVRWVVMKWFVSFVSFIIDGYGKLII